ncbi:hypothetical protein MHYP_G00182010 [Metynnis hypsauchen]
MTNLPLTFFLSSLPLADTSITPLYAAISLRAYRVKRCRSAVAVQADLSVPARSAHYTAFYSPQPPNAHPLLMWVAQLRAELLRSGVRDSIFSSAGTAAGQPGEITFNSISISPAVPLSTISYHISPLPAASVAEMGEIEGSQSPALTPAVRGYI